jgi:hypothetical protein
MTTNDGIEIDFNPLLKEVDSSMRSNFESHSHITDSSEFQSKNWIFPK